MTPVRRCLSPLAILLLALVSMSLLAADATAQANVNGQWQTLPNLMPINPVHVALMRNGRVLVVSGSGNDSTNTTFQVGVFDPQTGTVTTQTVAWDMFCNGMAVLPDGRVFVNGGTLQYNPFRGEPRTSVYDPETGLFTDLQNMAHGRWYPTVTVLGDGTVMTFSGLRETGGTNTAVEIYTVGAGWSQEFGAGWTPPLYPRMHLLPDDTVFYPGPGTGSRKFNPATKTWTGVIATTNYSGTRTYGTSVLLPLTPANNYKPRVMIFGGGSPATATTEIIDLSAATPAWQFGPSMSQPRIQMSATILPNGKVLAIGGSVNDEDAATASLNVDLYDPVTNTFSSAGQNAFPHLYHSVSLLLPDATVWFAGGNPTQGSYEQRMEIYSPPYLFNSSGDPATRPTITSVPAAIGYGAGFQIQTPEATSISSIALVRPGSPTHAFDQDQRMINVSFTIGSGVLNASAPPNGNIAPPGYYMLFILNSSGVPSVAKFVQLSSTPVDPPPTGTTLVAAYSFNEGTGTVVADASGNGNAGTLVNATWSTAGKFGKALSFNGTNARVVINDSTSLHLSTGMTLEAWVRPTVAPNYWWDVIYKENDIYFLEGGSTGTNYAPAAGGSFSSGWAEVYGTAQLAANTWAHLAATYDGTTLRLYVNGALVGSRTVSGALASSTQALQIGGDALYGQQHFNGLIDEVRVYNRALSQAEIQSAMNTPVGGAPPPDTTPPTAPSNLTPTVVSSSQINLSWTASTDNVGVANYLIERCQNAGCSNFTQLPTTPTGTTYNDTGLLAATTYQYRVRARDAANNLSGYSNTASAMTTTPPPDTQPPTTPGSLTATAVGGTQINLSWTASTDNVAVTEYRVERCQGAGCSSFAQIATPTGTTYNNTGLSLGTPYSYRVRAADAANNLSAYSNIASATTNTTPPGLVAAYSFNEGTGPSVADASGSGNLGSLVNTAWSTQGKFGNALSFNGTNARVVINDSTSLHLSTGMTLEAWVRPTVAPTYWWDVIFKETDIYFLEAGSLGTNYAPAAGGTFSSGATEVYGTTQLAANTWTHLAATFDGTTLRLYVNGTQVSSKAVSGALGSSTQALQIGGDAAFGQQYFNGLIDEVRVYNRALSQTEVQSDMNTPI